MKIDEKEIDSLANDHKRITLTFGKTKSQNPETGVHGLKLSDQQIAEIAKSLENNIERQSGILGTLVIHNLSKIVQQKGTRT